MSKSNLWILIKYFISIDFFVFTSIGQIFKNKSKKSASFQGIFTILVYLGLFLYVIPKFAGDFAISLASNEGSYYVTAIVVSLFVATLFFSLAQSFIFIEKNNESEFLLTLPISGEDIIKSRIYSLVFTFLFSFYLLIIYFFIIIGIKLNLPVYYYIFMILGFILLNMFTVILSGIIILLFGQLIRTSKFFNRFSKGIYGVFVIVLFVAYMIFVQTLSNPNIAITPSQIFLEVESILSTVFFFVTWVKNIIVSKSILNSSLNLIFGVVLVIIVMLVFNILSKLNYLKILRCANVANTESSTVIEKRKKFGLTSSKRSKWMVLFNKELQDIVSNPTYILQIIMFDLMIVVFSGIGMYFAFSNKSLLVPVINNIITFVKFSDLILYSFSIGCILGLFAGLGSMTVSSVTREGKAFWVVATAPIGINTQLTSRVCGCQFIHLITYLIVILVSTLIYTFNPLVYISLILGIILTLFVSGLINMILGLLNPYFDWKTAKEAVNGGAGGLNVFLSILINYGIYALLIFTVVFGLKNEIEINTLAMLDILILFILGIIAYIVDYKLFKRVLKRL